MALISLCQNATTTFLLLQYKLLYIILFYISHCHGNLGLIKTLYNTCIFILATTSNNV